MQTSAPCDNYKRRSPLDGLLMGLSFEEIIRPPLDFSSMKNLRVLRISFTKLYGTGLGGSLAHQPLHCESLLPQLECLSLDVFDGVLAIDERPHWRNDDSDPQWTQRTGTISDVLQNIDNVRPYVPRLRRILIRSSRGLNIFDHPNLRRMAQRITWCQIEISGSKLLD